MTELHQKLEDYVDKNPEKGIWKTVIEIEEICEIEIHEVLLNICDYSLIRKRTQGQDKYTTHKIYEKHNSFWHKLFDAWIGYYS